MATSTPDGPGQSAEMSAGLTLAMALVAGVAVANLYYNQPMLGIMERAVGDPALTGLVPTATQLGYAAGLFFLLPLGDIADRRRLIAWQLAAMAAALALVALAPSAPFLIAASLLLGICSSVAQQIIPFAAALADPARRGKTMGTVMAGVLCGILLSRTVAGFVGTHLGWRAMFWIAAPLALGAAGLMALLLPRNHPHATMPYGQALASVVGLWRRYPTLRRATLVQAALFAAFTVFWTILAFHLQEPRYGLGADVAGLFGILGVVGVIAAPVAGRIADRHGPARVVLACSTLAVLSWVLFAAWLALPGLAIGVLLLDFGVPAAFVANQHIVFALDPAARSRLNTIFMTITFIGGAIGSAGASLAWSPAGWPAVCGFGALMAAMALVLARPR